MKARPRRRPRGAGPRGAGLRGGAGGRGAGASRRAGAGPTGEDEDIRSLSRIYDSQPRTFSLRERERIVRKARETLEAVEEGPVLPPVEYAAVEDGDVMDEPVLEPPERAFVSTPEHLARYLREMEAGPEKERVEVPDVEGLPSFFQGNPWVAILARRAREAKLVDEHEGKISEEDSTKALSSSELLTHGELPLNAHGSSASRGGARVPAQSP